MKINPCSVGNATYKQWQQSKVLRNYRNSRLYYYVDGQCHTLIKTLIFDKVTVTQVN